MATIITSNFITRWQFQYSLAREVSIHHDFCYTSIVYFSLYAWATKMIHVRVLPRHGLRSDYGYGQLPDYKEMHSIYSSWRAVFCAVAPELLVFL